MIQIDNYYNSLLLHGEKVAPWMLAGILSSKLQKAGIKYSIKAEPGYKDLFKVTILEGGPNHAETEDKRLDSVLHVEQPGKN